MKMVSKCLQANAVKFMCVANKSQAVRGRGSVTDSEGWFPTRDAGSMDADGYLFLEGRADDVIVRGGENLSPGKSKMSC